MLLTACVDVVLFRANYVVDAFLFAPAADCPAQPFFVRLATARTSRTAAGGQVCGSGTARAVGLINRMLALGLVTDCLQYWVFTCKNSHRSMDETWKT